MRLFVVMHSFLTAGMREHTVNVRILSLLPLCCDALPCRSPRIEFRKNWACSNAGRSQVARLLVFVELFAKRRPVGREEVICVAFFFLISIPYAAIVNNCREGRGYKRYISLP